MAKERDNRLAKLLLLIAIVVIILLLLRRKVNAATVATTQTATPTPASTSYVSYSTPNETVQSIITSTTDLTGTAPIGAKWGINTNTGETFFVNSLGEWEESTLPVTINEPITGTFAAVHLDNSQSFTSDVTMTGVLLLNHYSLVVTTDLQSLQGIDTILSVVANNTVRVTVRNNTGNTVSIPQLTISALQLN